MGQNVSSSSSSSELVCLDEPGVKVGGVRGDPADLGVDKMKHASHPHPLYQFKLQTHDETNCRICSSPIDGFAHGCEACHFFIHYDHCLSLEVQIHHKSHPAHPLRLRPLTPTSQNICDACLSPVANTRRTFYRCGICDYDLHVHCATLPEIQMDHEMNLIQLHYSLPVEASVRCSKCSAGISRRGGGWVWYAKNTGYTAHLDCGRPKLCQDKSCILRHVMRFLILRKKIG